MKKIDLNGCWKISGAGFKIKGEGPGSVYSNLLQQGLIEDPYYRDNEMSALELMSTSLYLPRNLIFLMRKGNLVWFARALTLFVIYILTARWFHALIICIALLFLT